MDIDERQRWQARLNQGESDVFLRFDGLGGCGDGGRDGGLHHRRSYRHEVILHCDRVLSFFGVAVKWAGLLGSTLF
jgi:hypothetical protein